MGWGAGCFVGWLGAAEVEGWGWKGVWAGEAECQIQKGGVHHV